MSSADDRRATLAELFAGRYTIGERLDWGGLALVYRASSPEHELALAVLPLDCESHPDNRPLFEGVLEDLRGMDVPGLTRVVEGGVQLGVPFLAYAYEPLEPLGTRLAEGALEPAQALAVAEQLLGVLARFHERGVCHGDLTPRNVLLDAGGGVRVFGLGIAQLLRRVNPADVTGPTGRGSGKGAVRYLAPEILGGALGDVRSDLFSVGALLYHMVVGRPPGAGRAPDGAFDAVPGLEEVLERALARDPDARFESAEAMREALARVREGAPARDEPATPATPLWHSVPTNDERTRPRPWVPALAIASLLGAGAVGAYVLRAEPRSTASSPSASSSASSPSASSPSASSSPTGREDGPEAAALPPPVSATERVNAAAAPAEASAGAEDAQHVEASDHAAPADDAAPGPTLAAEGPLSGSLPQVLEDALGRLAAGESFDDPDLDVLYAYTRANPRDVRGHLVLARAFMSRRWYTAALERYEHALRLDPVATEDPQVLEDLVTIVQRGDEMLDAAWPNIRRFYGRRALPVVEARIASAVRWDHKRPLRRLASRLRHLPEASSNADE